MIAQYLNGAQSARYLGVCSSFFQAKIRPEIPRQKFSPKCVRYAVRDLEAWAAARRIENQEDARRLADGRRRRKT